MEGWGSDRQTVSLSEFLESAWGPGRILTDTCIITPKGKKM